MADTTFTDYSTVISASWLNDVNDLVYSTAEKDASNWITGATQPNMAWIASGAKFAAASTGGGIGITGFSRTSDSADSGTPASIGVTGFAYNNDTYAKPAWGGYFEGKSSSTGAGWTGGLEVDAVNNNTFADANAYTAIGTTTQFTTGIWIASGGDPTVNPSAADATFGITLAKNGAYWGKGIVFLDDALRVRSLGSYSTQIAIEMARNQSIDWVNPDGNRAAWIASSCTTGQKSLGLAFITTALRIVDDADGIQFQVSKTASATSFLGVTGSSTDFPTLQAVSDSSSNVSIIYKTKGTGSHYFQDAAGATQAEITRTSGATSFLQLVASTVSTPTLTASSGSVKIGTPLILAKGLLPPVPRTVSSGTGTVTTDDFAVICDFAGSVTLTLPAAASYPGAVFYIKTKTANTVVSASSNVVPKDGSAASTAILPATDGAWAMIQSNGTDYDMLMSGI